MRLRPEHEIGGAVAGGRGRAARQRTFAPKKRISFVDFTAGGPLAQVPGATYSRSGVMAIEDYRGHIKQIAANEVPIAGGRRVKNLLPYSDTFNSWSKSNCTIGTDAAGNYDSVIENATTGAHRPWTSTPSVIAGAAYLFVIAAKPGIRGYLQIALGGAYFGSNGVMFDLSDGSVYSHSGVDGYGSIARDDGGYDLYVRATCIASGAADIYVNPSPDGSSVSYAGSSGAVAVYLDKAQLEVASPGQTAPSERVSKGVTDPYELATGPELVAEIPASAVSIYDYAGSSGAYADGVISNTVAGSDSGYPRFRLGPVLTLGKRYRVSGRLSNPAATKVFRVRLAASGSTADIPYDTATGVFDGYATAEYTYVEFLSDGTSLWSQTLEEFSVRELPFYNIPGFGADGVAVSHNDEFGYPLPRYGAWRENWLKQSEDLSSTAWSQPVGVSVGSDGWQTLVKTLGVGSEARSQSLGDLGDSAGMLVELRAGTSATVSIGIYNGGWGTVGNWTLEIVRGPGAIAFSTLPVISGLEQTESTVVRIRRRSMSGTAYAYIYPGNHNSTTIGDSIKLRHLTVVKGDRYPDCHTPTGAYNEPGRWAANELPNSTMRGAGVGAWPTGWVPSDHAGIGMSVVGAGVLANGRTRYCDVRYTGTAIETAYPTFRPCGYTEIAAKQGDRWASVIALDLIAGAAPASRWVQCVERDISGNYLGASDAIEVNLDGSAVIAAREFTSASAAFVQPSIAFVIPSGETVDFTIRVTEPQLEKGGNFSFFVPTSNGRQERRNLTGLANRPGRVNVIRSASDLSTAAWTRRGSISCTPAYDEAMGGLYTQVRALGASGVNDAYQIISGLTQNARHEMAFFVRNVSGSGIIRVVHPDGWALGEALIDLSKLSSKGRIDRDHPAMTVSTDFVSNGAGSCGFVVHAHSGSPDFDVSIITLAEGTTPPPLIPNDSTTAAAVLGSATGTVVDFVDGPGAVVAEFTQHSRLGSAAQTVATITDGTDRVVMQTENTGGNNRVLVNDGGTWAVTNMDRASMIGRQRQSVRFKAGAYRSNRNGGDVMSNSYASAVFPGSADLWFGHDGAGASALDGDIAAITFHRDLSDSRQDDLTEIDYA